MQSENSKNGLNAKTVQHNTFAYSMYCLHSGYILYREDDSFGIS